VSISSTSTSAEGLPPPALDSDSSTPQQANSPQQAKSPWREELAIFASTFFTIFLAELGDKTQLTTLLLSAQSHAPWIVFAGAGSALVATSLIGVLLGRWLAQRVPPRTLEVAAGVLLLVLAVLLVWDVVQG
jgi:Ca2+/H+ antiporter, TMEM165/GDT1 family